MNSTVFMIRLLGITLVTLLLGGCVSDLNIGCRRTEECGPGRTCAAGQCRPVDDAALESEDGAPRGDVHRPTRDARAADMDSAGDAPVPAHDAHVDARPDTDRRTDADGRGPLDASGVKPDGAPDAAAQPTDFGLPDRDARAENPPDASLTAVDAAPPRPDTSTVVDVRAFDAARWLADASVSPDGLSPPACTPGGACVVANAVGDCATGTITCETDHPVCVPNLVPTAERCDLADNDCDGETDEDFADLGEACGDAPFCAVGFTICTDDGLATRCSVDGPIPGVETCNGEDDDCDGEIDDGFAVGVSCRVGQGQCERAGLFVCDETGTNVRCDAVAGEPSVEFCDGLDNDCDGLDDAVEGVCALAPDADFLDAALSDAAIRDADHVDAATVDAVVPEMDLTPLVDAEVRPETCNGLDDDRNGMIDDVVGIGELCRVGIGVCTREARTTCLLAGIVGCDIAPGDPHEERCNGLDDDCDGLTDEDACDPAGPGFCERRRASGEVFCEDFSRPLSPAWVRGSLAQAGVQVAVSSNGVYQFESADADGAGGHQVLTKTVSEAFRLGFTARYSGWPLGVGYFRGNERLAQQAALPGYGYGVSIESVRETPRVRIRLLPDGATLAMTEPTPLDDGALHRIEVDWRRGLPWEIRIDGDPVPLEANRADQTFRALDTVSPWLSTQRGATRSEIDDLYIDTDSDGDGVLDPEDNCFDVPNPDQSDGDGNGRGTICDDPDVDGLDSSIDPCPFNGSPDQRDIDQDGTGDVCQTTSPLALLVASSSEQPQTLAWVSPTRGVRTPAATLPAAVSACDGRPDGQEIASIRRADNSLWIGGLAGNEERVDVGVQNPQFLRDGRLVYGPTDGRSIRIYDGLDILTVRAAVGNQRLGAYASTDGRTLSVVTLDGTASVEILDGTLARLRGPIPVPTEAGVVPWVRPTDDRSGLAVAIAGGPNAGLWWVDVDAPAPPVRVSAAGATAVVPLRTLTGLSLIAVEPYPRQGEARVQGFVRLADGTWMNSGTLVPAWVGVRSKCLDAVERAPEAEPDADFDGLADEIDPQPVSPARIEVCNGLDDDQNGAIDDVPVTLERRSLPGRFGNTQVHLARSNAGFAVALFGDGNGYGSEVHFLDGQGVPVRESVILDMRPRVDPAGWPWASVASSGREYGAAWIGASDAGDVVYFRTFTLEGQPSSEPLLLGPAFSRSGGYYNQGGMVWTGTEYIVFYGSTATMRARVSTDGGHIIEQSAFGGGRDERRVMWADEVLGFATESRFGLYRPDGTPVGDSATGGLGVWTGTEFQVWSAGRGLLTRQSPSGRIYSTYGGGVVSRGHYDAARSRDESLFVTWDANFALAAVHVTAESVARAVPEFRSVPLGISARSAQVLWNENEWILVHTMPGLVFARGRLGCR